ncbi:MAG: hypothetical protein E6767_03580 [Dysgonomonas sp.]|nr:hypothetical protein [Dysgonomonas sp.]
MKNIFFGLAIIGWLIAMIVHLLSIVNFDIWNRFPYIWVLHVGVFVVWIPAIISLMRNKELKDYGSLWGNPFYFLKIILRQIPKWFIVIVALGFIYTFISSVIYAASNIGMTDIVNGEYVLQEHGDIVKNLTEQEYHSYNSSQLRYFSGGWMVFYSVGIILLYPKKE